jgi:hypothetical protein
MGLDDAVFRAQRSLRIFDGIVGPGSQRSKYR